jgi:CBS domain-containing protein
MRADATDRASGLIVPGSETEILEPADSGQVGGAGHSWQERGSASMKLAEIMTKALVTAHDHDAVDEVAARMIRHRIGCLPVVDDGGQLVGIVTAADFGAKEHGCPFPPFCAPMFPSEQADELARHAAADEPGCNARAAREIMTPQPIALTADATVVEAVAKMLHLGIDRIPVVHCGVPVGIAAREDILRLVLRLLSGWSPDAGRESPSSDGRSPAEGAGAAALDWPT